MTTHTDLFEARTALESAAGIITYYRLEALTKWGVQGLDRLPFTIKILLENVLRHAGGELVNEDEVLSLARWVPGQTSVDVSHEGRSLFMACQNIPDG